MFASKPKRNKDGKVPIPKISIMSIAFGTLANPAALKRKAYTKPQGNKPFKSPRIYKLAGVFKLRASWNLL